MSLTDTPLFTANYTGDSGGSTNYYYWLQVKYATGDTAMFACKNNPVTVLALSHNNVVSLNWTPMPFAVSFSVFRNTVNTPPVTDGTTATALCISYNYPTQDGLVDNGLPTFTVTPPANAVH